DRQDRKQGPPKPSRADSFCRLGNAAALFPRSASRADHQRLEVPLDRSAAETPCERRGSRIGRVAEPRRIAGLDLVAERRSLTEADGGIARRGGTACALDRLDGNVDETGGGEVLPDLLHVVIALRGAGEEARRVVGEELGERFRYHVLELALGET